MFGDKERNRKGVSGESNVKRIQKFKYKIIIIIKSKLVLS